MAKPTPATKNLQVIRTQRFQVLALPNETQPQVNSVADRSSTTPPTNSNNKDADMSEESAVLQYLSSNETIANTFPWAEEQGLDHEAVVGAIKSLLVEAYVVADDLTFSYYTLTDEGKSIAQDGSQEFLVFQAVKAAGDGGITIPELQDKVGKAVAKIGMGNCMKNKWIKKDGGNLVANTDSVQDETKENLQTLESVNGDPAKLGDKVSA